MYSFDYIKELPLNHVQMLLGSEFTPPPLLTCTNTDNYANKLSAFASFLICCSNGKDLGFIAYYENIDRNELYITLIAVRKGLRHTGIGSELLDNLEAHYKETPLNCIKLEVDKENTGAHDFYLNHGFVEIEDRTKKILMEKRF